MNRNHPVLWLFPCELVKVYLNTLSKMKKKDVYVLDNYEDQNV